MAESDPILTTQPASHRGQRLFPPRSSRLYWVLTRLRCELESIISQVVGGDEAIGSGDLVDFGCGNMPYRPLLQPHVGRYLGCDLPGNEAAELITDVPGTIPVSDQSVSVVLSNQVLEHVEHPHEYLNEARRVLLPDGILILSTHGVWKYHPDPRDYWRWTCEGLRKQIQDCGFQIIRFRGIMGPRATALQLLQDQRIPHLPRAFRSWYSRYMQLKIEIADRRCSDESRDQDACVYLVVAKKV